MPSLFLTVGVMAQLPFLSRKTSSVISSQTSIADQFRFNYLLRLRNPVESLKFFTNRVILTFEYQQVLSPQMYIYITLRDFIIEPEISATYKTLVYIYIRNEGSRIFNPLSHLFILLEFILHE